MGQFGFVEKSWLPGGVRFSVVCFVKSCLFSKDPGSFFGCTILTRGREKSKKKSDQIRVRGCFGRESRGRAVGVRTTSRKDVSVTVVLRTIQTSPTIVRTGRLYLLECQGLFCQRYAFYRE